MLTSTSRIVSDSLFLVICSNLLDWFGNVVDSLASATLGASCSRTARYLFGASPTFIIRPKLLSLHLSVLKLKS